MKWDKRKFLLKTLGQIIVNGIEEKIDNLTYMYVHSNIFYYYRDY
jgi:hypothetical protein